MKFYEGMWLIKDGYELNRPSTMYTYKFENNKLYIYLPFVKVVHRGNTLDGGMITGEISFFNNNIHFEFYHKKKLNRSLSKFNIKREIQKAKIKEEEEYLDFSNGNLILRIYKDNFKMEVIENEQVKIVIPQNALSYVTGPDKTNYMTCSTKISVGEKLYGLGERFTDFIKNSQSIKIWNEDGGTASEQTYKNIPFLLSTKSYGIFVDHSESVEYEIGTELVEKSQFCVEGETLRFDIINANNLKEVVDKFSKLSGDIPRLPEWTYGLWLSTSFTTDYNEKTVLEFIDGMIDRDIPFEVFHFDCFWMKEYEWMNFEFNEELFPDPEGMMKKIHDRGKKICVWINPYIGQKSKAFDEGLEKGYFVKGEDGEVWQWDRWQASMALVDFTNEDAKNWYKEKLRNLVKMGVDSFKTDFGERIPVPSKFYETDVVEYADGSCPNQMHNYYTYIYNKAVFEVLEEEKGKGEACLFARSGTVGSNSLPVHWGGDCLSNYESMAESLRGGLSLSLSGYAYWSHDIGGFEAGCTPDIYKRWTQFGLLSSHSRYHGNSEYKVPWFYGDEAVEVSRYFAKLKNSLMPYFKELEDEAINLGSSILRPLVLEFFKDPTTHFIDRQYMLGDRLLVAPIFNDKGTCEYYLPKDMAWYNILSNEVKAGGEWYDEKFDYFNLPLLLKEDSYLVIKADSNKASFDVGDNFEILAFATLGKKEIKVIKDKVEKVIVIEDDKVIDDAGLKFNFKYISK